MALQAAGVDLAQAGANQGFPMLPAAGTGCLPPGDTAEAVFLPAFVRL